MAIGTDKEIFGEEAKKRIKPDKKSNGGRPKINRDLVIRLLKAIGSDGYPRYNNSQIARQAKCSSKSVGRIYKEAVENGEIDPESRKDRSKGLVEAEFDAECERAKGYSFKSWLSRLKAGKTIFNYCSKVWYNIWDSPNLVDASDHTHPLADQLALAWLDVFGDDKKRIRNRKKLIRYIFTFLGRGDINDRHLTMRKGADPIPIRRVAEIQMIDFPMKLGKCIDHMEKCFPDNGEDGIRFKLVSLMRTGDPRDEREFLGLRKGSGTKTFILMTDPNTYRIHVFAKLGEEWEIIWLPKEVKESLFERYNKTESGELIFPVNIEKYRKEWGDITEEIIGRRMTLHDLRKVSLTWFYCMDIPMEIAIKINVGWQDMNTAVNVYLENRGMLRKTAKRRYREQIPEWFKEGLDEFTREDSIEIIQKQPMSD